MYVCKPYNVGHDYEVRDATVTDADHQIQRSSGPDATFLVGTLRPTTSYGHEAKLADGTISLISACWPEHFACVIALQTRPSHFKTKITLLGPSN